MTENHDLLAAALHRRSQRTIMHVLGSKTELMLVVVSDLTAQSFLRRLAQPWSVEECLDEGDSGNRQEVERPETYTEAALQLLGTTASEIEFEVLMTGGKVTPIPGGLSINDRRIDIVLMDGSREYLDQICGVVRQGHNQPVLPAHDLLKSIGTSRVFDAFACTFIKAPNG